MKMLNIFKDVLPSIIKHNQVEDVIINSPAGNIAGIVIVALIIILLMILIAVLILLVYTLFIQEKEFTFWDRKFRIHAKEQNLIKEEVKEIIKEYFQQEESRIFGNYITQDELQNKLEILEDYTTKGELQNFKNELPNLLEEMTQ